MRTTWREMPRGNGTTKRSSHSSSGVDQGSLQAVLARFGRCGELLGILHEALAGDGSAKVYALLPPGLRVQ